MHQSPVQGAAVPSAAAASSSAPDQLARTVVGDVAAPLDLEQRRLRHRQQVLGVGAAPGGDHVRVLHQEQGVGDLVALAGRHQLQLPRPDVAELARA